VGTKGGFFPAYVKHPNGIPCPLDPSDLTGNTANPDGPFNLMLAPAERADILVDFTGQNGNSFILYSDAPGPFPFEAELYQRQSRRPAAAARAPCHI